MKKSSNFIMDWKKMIKQSKPTKNKSIVEKVRRIIDKGRCS